MHFMERVWHASLVVMMASSGIPDNRAPCVQHSGVLLLRAASRLDVTTKSFDSTRARREQDVFEFKLRDLVS